MAKVSPDLAREQNAKNQCIVCTVRALEVLLFQRFRSQRHCYMLSMYAKVAPGQVIRYQSNIKNCPCYCDLCPAARDLKMFLR